MPSEGCDFPRIIEIILFSLISTFLNSIIQNVLILRLRKFAQLCKYEISLEYKLIIYSKTQKCIMYFKNITLLYCIPMYDYYLCLRDEPPTVKVIIELTIQLTWFHS